MPRLVAFALVVVGLGVGVGGASTSATAWSVDSFRAALVARLKQDGRGGLAYCRGMSRLEIDCAFRGDPNAGARGLLGRIDHREHMALQLAEGRLAAIVLNGQRNTKAAEQHFIGIVTSAIGALSPDFDNPKIEQIVTGLGLTRDDASPGIGEVRSADGPGWSIQCLSQFSTASTDLSCTIEPGAS